jgi:hypothetical protein
MTADSAPDPDAAVAIAAALRLLHDARLAAPPQFLCVACGRRYPSEELVRVEPARCRNCATLRGPQP